MQTGREERVRELSEPHLEDTRDVADVGGPFIGVEVDRI